MRNLITVAVLSLCVSLCYAACPQYVGLDWYRGFWGVDLFETNTPNILFDSTDEAQIQEAKDRGVDIFFYIRPIIFNFKYGSSGYTYTIRSSWKDDFAEAYGNQSFPKIPFNVSGITPVNPNGFFLGAQLMYYGVSESDIDNIAHHIKNQYPDAIVAYDEAWEIFEGEEITAISEYVDIVSISNYWSVYQPNTAATTNNHYNKYIQYVYPISSSGHKFVWSVNMYNANNGDCVDQPACHDEEACDVSLDWPTCSEVMKKWAVAVARFMCDDRTCDDAEVTHTGKFVGLWAWHWNDFDAGPNWTEIAAPRPKGIPVRNYQIGLRSVSELNSFEAATIGNICETWLGSAPSSSFIVGLTLVALFIATVN